MKELAVFGDADLILYSQIDLANPNLDLAVVTHTQQDSATVALNQDSQLSMLLCKTFVPREYKL